MIFVPEARGLLCPMLLVSNSGTTTTSGFAPLATPRSGVLGGVIATCAIEPSTVLPSLIAAMTLTDGGVYSTAACRRSNVTVQATPRDVPPLAAVSTSCPVDCVHTPAVPKRFDVDGTGKLTESAVCVPVSPTIVTLDPVGKSMLAVSVTDIVTIVSAIGVLCPMAK